MKSQFSAENKSSHEISVVEPLKKLLLIIKLENSLIVWILDLVNYQGVGTGRSTSIITSELKNTLH